MILSGEMLPHCVRKICLLHFIATEPKIRFYDQFLANAYAVRLEMEICSTDLVSERAGAPIMTVS